MLENGGQRQKEQLWIRGHLVYASKRKLAIIQERYCRKDIVGKILQERYCGKDFMGKILRSRGSYKCCVIIIQFLGGSSYDRCNFTIKKSITGRIYRS